MLRDKESVPMMCEASQLLEKIAAFDKAVDGDSGDAELDAAIGMKSAAIAFLQKVSERDVQLAELIGAFDAKDDDVWNNNSIQFPRLLSEVHAIIGKEMIQEIANSMDLPFFRVRELLQRADDEFERLKPPASRF
jgi:hypothetical protein